MILINFTSNIFIENTENLWKINYKDIITKQIQKLYKNIVETYYYLYIYNIIINIYIY